MKLLKISAGLLMLTGGVLFPQMVEAQLMRNLFTNPCCNVCGHQQCTCTTTRPVIETRLRQQQCLTYQDRKRISCKTEPVCETVPVTKVDCVTVDEGCYQMVWVPKPVTKAVPRTELHQRVSYRTVPIEVTERVPVMTTRIVPEKTIRYVTEHRTVTTTAPVPLCPPPPCPPVSACPPGGLCSPGSALGIPSVVPGFGAPMIGPPAGYGGPSPVAVPYSAMRGQSPDSTAPMTAGLVPDARFADPAHSPASHTRKTAYAEQVPVARPVSATMRRPSAAAVWQTPRRTP